MSWLQPWWCSWPFPHVCHSLVLKWPLNLHTPCLGSNQEERGRHRVYKGLYSGICGADGKADSTALSCKGPLFTGGDKTHPRNQGTTSGPREVCKQLWTIEWASQLPAPPCTGSTCPPCHSPAGSLGSFQNLGLHTWSEQICVYLSFKWTPLSS